MALAKNNTTGVTGVTFENYSHKYRAYVHLGGEKISLGYFDTLSEAAKARSDAQQFYKTPLVSRLRLVDFLSKKYGLTADYTLSGVLDALKAYKFGNESFPTFAINYFKNAGTFYSEPIYPELPTLLQWMNGMSMSRISKTTGQTPTEVKQTILTSISQLRGPRVC